MSEDSEENLLGVTLAYYYIRQLQLGRLVQGLQRRQHITRQLLSDHDEESFHESFILKLQRVKRYIASVATDIDP